MWDLPNVWASPVIAAALAALVTLAGVCVAILNYKRQQREARMDRQRSLLAHLLSTGWEQLNATEVYLSAYAAMTSSDLRGWLTSSEGEHLQTVTRELRKLLVEASIEVRQPDLRSAVIDFDCALKRSYDLCLPQRHANEDKFPERESAAYLRGKEVAHVRPVGAGIARDALHKLQNIAEVQLAVGFTEPGIATKYWRRFARSAYQRYRLICTRVSARRPEAWPGARNPPPAVRPPLRFSQSDDSHSHYGHNQ